MAEIYEVADDIFRIASFDPSYPVTVTQFLIRDENPLLFHTGPKSWFSDTLDAVKRIVEPSKLRYIRLAGRIWRVTNAAQQTISWELRRKRSRWPALQASSWMWGTSSSSRSKR